GLQQPPPCWAVLCQDRVAVVLLAVGPELFLLDSTSCSVLSIPDPSLLLQEKFCEFNTGIRTPPKQMVWCTRPRSRQRAVVLAWERQLMVVGNSSECIRYPLGSGNAPRAAATSSGTHTAPPEGPLDALCISQPFPIPIFLQKQSQKADEYLREIREQQLLPEAVGQCIEAAGYEHEPDTQKSLLRAASFGKCFLDKFPPEGFVRMCQDLRVLNAIRDYQIGIPLTFTQYKQLTIEVLLDRLVLRRLYPLAIRICEFLRLPEIQGVSRILAHWACSKVQQKDKSDEEVAQAINQKLGDTAGISYSDIATLAYDCGRAELAIKLLEYEPRSGEQVPLLLKMKRSKLALGKAIESGDTDLVYTVVLHLKNELNRGTFFMTLQNQPVALSLYRQ
ncbi:VPS16 protein, partial [Anthoscopus minutus]|nr:VPS16 protein [Anthoscopus minutus]